MTLAEHLAALNAEKLAWMAVDPDNRWTGLYDEDLAHWAEIGVLTVQDFQRYELQSLVWEMYKDVTGIRPRHMDFDSMSLEDLQREVDYLEREMERSIEEDKFWAEQAEHEAELMEASLEPMMDDQPDPIDYVACHYQEGWL